MTRESSRSDRRRETEFDGPILAVRRVEDSIRATRKYTEGVHTSHRAHPVQGEEFPSRRFYKYYEVYPSIEVSLDMPVFQAISWLFGHAERIDVMFWYDYSGDRASVRVKAGTPAVDRLAECIPGFGEALGRVANGSKPETNP